MVATATGKQNISTISYRFIEVSPQTQACFIVETNKTPSEEEMQTIGKTLQEYEATHQGLDKKVLGLINNSENYRILCKKVKNINVPPIWIIASKTLTDESITKMYEECHLTPVARAYDQLTPPPSTKITEQGVIICHGHHVHPLNILNKIYVASEKLIDVETLNKVAYKIKIKIEIVSASQKNINKILEQKLYAEKKSNSKLVDQGSTLTFPHKAKEVKYKFITMMTNSFSSVTLLAPPSTSDNIIRSIMKNLLNIHTQIDDYVRALQET